MTQESKWEAPGRQYEGWSGTKEWPVGSKETYRG